MEETKKDYETPDMGVFSIMREGIICASVSESGLRDDYQMEEW